MASSQYNSYNCDVNNSASKIANFLVLLFLLMPLSFFNIRIKESFFDCSSYQSIIPIDPCYDDSWYLDKIDAEKAWEITTGFDTISVGIIDSGINDNISLRLSYDDLYENLDDEASIDISGSDYLNPFYDYLSADENKHGHGTRVASVLGSRGDNEVGNAGLCWDINMVSIKCGGNYYDINYPGLESIFLNNNNNYRGNIPLMNMSFGTWIDANSNNQLLSGFEYALSTYGGLIVLAAGNNTSYGGINFDGNPSITMFPQCLNYENIIVVGNSDSSDNRVYSSNYGASTVDLFAPGSSVYSPLLELITMS